MIKVLLIIPIFSFHFLNAQHLKNPESICKDPKSDNYYVSNHKGNSILRFDENDQFHEFAEVEGPLGNLIIGQTLYVASDRQEKNRQDDAVLGFDLKSGQQIFEVILSNSQQLNDLTASDKYLFVSDRKDKKIYKINIVTKEVTILIDGQINTPNGLFFDSKNDRLLICNTIDHCSIYSYDFKLNKLTILVATQYANMDGLIIDHQDNVVVTSWGPEWKTSQLLSFDPMFEHEPIVLLANADGMADIAFDPAKKEIIMAKWFTNSIGFLSLGTEKSYIEKTTFKLLESKDKNWQIIGLPFKGNSKYELEIRSLGGKLLSTQPITVNKRGISSFNPKQFKLTAGTYWIIVKTNSSLHQSVISVP